MKRTSGGQLHHHHITPLAVDLPEARVPTNMYEYLFDLQGFLIMRGLLSKADVDDANARTDEIPHSLAATTVTRFGYHATPELLERLTPLPASSSTP